MRPKIRVRGSDADENAPFPLLLQRWSCLCGSWADLAELRPRDAPCDAPALAPCARALPDNAARAQRARPPACAHLSAPARLHAPAARAPSERAPVRPPACARRLRATRTCGRPPAHACVGCPSDGAWACAPARARSRALHCVRQPTRAAPARRASAPTLRAPLARGRARPPADGCINRARASERDRAHTRLLALSRPGRARRPPDRARRARHCAT